eukprot:m51a1_g6800 putative adenylyl cyclase (587) ;mRNA; r:216392-221266
MKGSPSASLLEPLRGSQWWCSVARHMRVHLVAALFALMAAAVVVAAVVFEVSSEDELAKLEHGQAVEEATLFYGVLNGQIVALHNEVINYAFVDELYDLMQHKDPNGGEWANIYEDFHYQNLEALLLILPNGTMILGIMWDTNMEVVTASPTLGKQTSAELLQSGEASGLFWIPETDTPVILQSEYVRYGDGSGSDVGWLVYARNIQLPVPRIADVADLCVSLSSMLAPEVVTKFLNGLYSQMDEIVHRERATKVMTIGDAYVTVALKFQRLCSGKLMAESQQPLAFRMGVATGQCSSAMIGLKKRFFELWGPSEDSGINFIPEKGERLLTRVVRSLRFGAVIGIGALLAISIGALVGFLFGALDSTTGRLMDHRATADLTRVSHSLQSVLNELTNDASAWANWSWTVKYVTNGDPNGWIWSTYWANGVIVDITRIEGGVFFMLNKTVVNSVGFSYPSATRRDISPEEIAVLKDQLVGRKAVSGLIFDPFCKGKYFNSSVALQLRIGVSSGPVAGGIVGRRNWVYDLWSDTVNMAARLKAKAQPGTVLCDSRTRELTEGEFCFEEPQVIELKGKGAQTVFSLAGKR